jgi:hypothetical protein
MNSAIPASGLIGRRETLTRITDANQVLTELVCCVHGANEQNLPLQGRTVGWVRENLAIALNISPFAIALVDGFHVGEDRVLEVGKVLEFLHLRGRKGLGEVFSRESLIERMRMTQDDFEDLVAAGLPVHRMRDGSLRISETQLDRFLDRLAGQDGVSGDGGLAQLAERPTVASPIEESSMKIFVEKFDERFTAIQADLSTLIQQRVVKDFYSTEDVANIVNREAYTVREWCRYGRLRAIKRSCGRGNSPEWSIPQDELIRYQNEGLLPLRK